MTASRFSKTWWGQRFIDALEEFTEPGRLARGRSYAGESRIKQWKLEKGAVAAKIRGNINPYYGVFEEPTYKVAVKMKAIPSKAWKKVVASISARSGFVSKLMVDEMPENIEDAFSGVGSQLLPDSYQDFLVGCSCPDYFVPCKHIAGACYRLASLLDHDPFLLFEMRGLTRDKLHQELAKTALGKSLSEFLVGEIEKVEPADSYYTRPKSVELPEKVDAKNFWRGNKPLPTDIEPPVVGPISAVVIKKAGDYPPFWDKQTSFIEVMEEFYERVRKNSKKWM